MLNYMQVIHILTLSLLMLVVFAMSTYNIRIKVCVVFFYAKQIHAQSSLSIFVQKYLHNCKDTLSNKKVSSHLRRHYWCKESDDCTLNFLFSKSIFLDSFMSSVKGFSPVSSMKIQLRKKFLSNLIHKLLLMYNSLLNMSLYNVDAIHCVAICFGPFR